LKTENENSAIKTKKRSIFHKIVNYIIGFFLGIFLLILLILGFTQTSLFRNILRDQVVKIANSSLNGTISIGKIDGTIFTTLYIRDVTVNMKSDTLLKAKLIDVRTSPLQIFYKKIYVREVGIHGANIALLKDTAGNLNVSKLFKPKEKDTTESSFPFLIKASKVNLSGINFSLQDEAKKNSNAVYDNLNMSDLRIGGLNFECGAQADIDNKDFYLYIKKLAFVSNVRNFDLQNFSGDFLVNKQRIILGNLLLQTTRSNMELSLKNEGLNIFNKITKDSLNKSKTEIIFDAKKFSFDDLAAIIPSLNFMKGELEAHFHAAGNISAAEIAKLDLKYLETKLNCTGKIKNLDAGSKMQIAAIFKKSEIYENNIMAFMPELKLPVYKTMDCIKIDTLKFDGEPLYFNSRLSASINGGRVRTNLKLDFRPKDMAYNIDLLTSNLNLAPVVNMPVILNVDGKINGVGASLKNMKTDIALSADGTVIGGEKFDMCKLNGSTQNGLANLTFDAAAGVEKLKVNGNVDFTNPDDQTYTLNANVQKVNLATITMDTAMKSDLNFDISLKGKNFDPDKINADVDLNLNESSFQEYKINNTEINLSIADGENSERNLKLISEFGNITLNGKFKVKNIADLFVKEIALSKNEVYKKLNSSFPSLKLDPGQQEQAVESFGKNDFKDTDSAYIDFLIEFKDFSVFSRIFKSGQIDVDGKMSGSFKASPKGMAFMIKTDINYLQYWNDNDVIFINGMYGSLNVENKFNTFTLSDYDIKINFNVDKVYTGTEVQKINLFGSLKNNIFNVAASAEYEKNFSGRLRALADLSQPIIDLSVDTLIFMYNKLDVENSGPINIALNDNKFDIKNLLIKSGSARFSLTGLLALEGEQNLKLNLSGLNIKEVLKGINSNENTNPINANVNLEAGITGTFDAPVIVSRLGIYDLSFKDRKFGYLDCRADYKDKNTVFDVKVLDTANKNTIPKFSMVGNFPVDLAFKGVEKRVLDNENLKIKILFNDFDLAAVGNSIPQVSDVKGKINADLNFEGTMQKMNRSGYLNLTNGSFFVDANYISYKAGLKIKLTNDLLNIDELFVENANGVKRKGRINGHGKVYFDGYNINTAEVRLNGDLSVLSDESKNANLSLYGDLYMGTAGDVVFTYDKGKMNLTAPIEIRNADLTFPPFQTGIRSYNETFVYKYPVAWDTVKVVKKTNYDRVKETKIQTAQNKKEGQVRISNSMFDYDVDIKIKNQARIVFIINKESDSKLIADVGGSLKYQSIGGILNTQGEFKLLEGSRLEIIKNLDAVGSIRFESDISNPYLNILATYKGYIASDQNSSTQSGSSTSSKSGSEDEVTIKINFEGYFNELGKNITQNGDNVLIYTTADNLKNNTPDKSKGLSDAISFFTTGRFKIADGSATSLVGGVVSGLINSFTGDYVKSVDIQSGVNNTTKIKLTGEIGSVKYYIGGTTEMFQDLSNASIRLEHPIIENFILRLERKRAVIDNSSTSSSEMINELGLKYRFEF